MIARTFWGAKADKASTDKKDPAATGSKPKAGDPAAARAEGAGGTPEPRRAVRARSGERPDQDRSLPVDDLDLAVQKLSEGLEAIERQSRAHREPEPHPRAQEPARRPGARADTDTGDGRDFVAHSLDRLEARLEALSRRLQQRSGGSAAPEAPLSEFARDEVADIAEAERAAQLAESRRLAEAENARRKAELAAAEAAEADENARRDAEDIAEERRRQAILADARRHAEVIEARRNAEVIEAKRQAELAEARRQSELAEARREAETAEARRQAELADARRQSELAEARREAEAAEARRQGEVADARRQAAIAEARRQSEVAEARREAEAAEERRQAEAEAAAAQLQRQAEEAAEERRRQAEEAEEMRRRLLDEAESVRLADLAEARRQAEASEARRRTEIEEARKQTEIAAARRDAEMGAALERQFSQVEARIDALQTGFDENQVEPVRAELLELVKEMSELSRGGRATASSLDAIGARLDEMEQKLGATRNLAANRLGDIQGRLTGLVARIDEIEVEIPGFDAVRENQGAILERFDRMEGLVHRLVSADELLERVEGLKRQLQTSASQRDVTKVEEHILKLADRLDALPEELSDQESLVRIEAQLGGLAAEFAESRRQRKSAALELDETLAQISSQLSEVGETGRTPDLSGIEERISVLGAHLAEDRRFVGDTLQRLERRLTGLGTAIEAQEDDISAELIAGLGQKIDSIAAAISAQDAPGARRDIGGIDSKLDQIARQLAAHAEQLSRQQIAPLEARFDALQANLQGIAKHAQDSSAMFRPLVQKLQEFSDRLAALGGEGVASPLSRRLESIEERIVASAGRNADSRALQTQLEAIVSRLELLKGRSIDPSRLNDLFDRIEVAIRALTQERFERLEQDYDQAAIPIDRFDRLEKKIAESTEGIAGEKIGRLERKLDEIGRALPAGETIPPEELVELRADVGALRRELRSLAGSGQGEGNLGELMRQIAKRLDRLPQGVPATVADLEAQIERIARIVEEPDRSAMVQIETSLKTIEKRLDDTRRSLGYRPPREVGDVPQDEMDSVAGLARSLSDDVDTLKNFTEASERKTKDAIDSVQGTLEAVVKRMAFLERDADSADERRSSETATDARLSRSGSVAPTEQPAAAPERAESAVGGLLSRFTSRQLLKRATGGRAESFSPESEEVDDASDLPLEPGTDSPLSSSLSGAPSSDTEFMSGARKPRTSKPLLGDVDRGAARGEDHPVVDDDFLAAARRAARAAAAEVADPDDDASTSTEAAANTGRRRGRGALIAAAIAAVLAIGVIGVASTKVWPYDNVVALVNGKLTLADLLAPAESPETTAAAPAETPDTTAAASTAGDDLTAAPAPSTPPVAEAVPPAAASDELRAKSSESAAAPVSAESSAATPPPNMETAVTTSPTAAAMSAAPEAGAATETPATPSEVASITPAPEAPTASSSPAVAAASSAEGALPEAIGPAKLRNAALAGDQAAAFEVAMRFAEGRGVLPDMPAAVTWYERAAALGLAPAQYRLGSIYEKGLGVPRDLAKAQDWYRRAADAGNVKAMHNLAVLYAEGAGGEPDLERAASLFKQAAEHGVRDSQFNLAILHARGLGVKQDLIEAYKWFAVAASSGDEESAKRRDIIAQALSPEDRAKAEAAAASFQPQPLVSEANEVQMPEGGWTDEDNSTSVEVKSDNELVALVQKLLAENGYDPGPPDGLLGTKTIDAIAEFQVKAGLPRTGQIDDGLVAALKNRST